MSSKKRIVGITKNRDIFSITFKDLNSIFRVKWDKVKELISKDRKLIKLLTKNDSKLTNNKFFIALLTICMSYYNNEDNKVKNELNNLKKQNLTKLMEMIL